MSGLFTSGGQSIGVSALALVLPMNIQGYYLYVVFVQSLSHIQLFMIPRTAARQASSSFTISWSFLKLMSIESVMPSHSPLSPSPAFNLSQHQGLFQ